MYDENNIFNKIINSQIPKKTIYEDYKILSFYDINPKAKVHALVIPKKQYIDFSDFASRGELNEVGEFFKKVDFIAKSILNLESFKLLTNNGKEAGQEVFHFHIHILSK